MRICGLLVLMLCLIFSKAQQNISIINQIQPSCSGACDGSITFSITAFPSPYSVTVTNTTCPTSNTINFSTTTVTINNLCKCDSNYRFSFFTTMTNIGNKYVSISPPTLNCFATNSAISCKNACNATATVFVLNGTPPYTHTWVPTGVNSATLSNACPTLYSVYSIDASGCKGSTQLLIINPPNPCVGIEEFQLTEEARVHPNPVISTLYISEENFLSIYNASGEVVKTEAKTKEIYVRDLPSGIYYLNVRSDSGKNYYRKFIKDNL